MISVVNCHRDHGVDARPAARAALDRHIADLNGELAPMRLQPVAADFGAAIKGLRSIDSMQDALDTTLAQAKIAADGQARVIRHNVANFKGVTTTIAFEPNGELKNPAMTLYAYKDGKKVALN